MASALDVSQFARYGNMGCRIFKGGIKTLDRFLAKNQYPQGKNCIELTLNFRTKIYLNLYTYPPRKLDNLYCHNARLAIFCNHPRLDKLAQQCTTEEGFKIGAINQSTIFLLLGLVATIYGHFWILLITVILLVVSIRILIES